MNKLLSQDEVDSLLKGLDTGDIDAGYDEIDPGSDVESYDWSSQALNIKGSMPLLEVVNGRFSQAFSASLTGMLRKMIDVSPDPMETIKFDEFKRSLPVPTSMHLFKIDPLKGPGILVIESRLVFSLIEVFFGGSGIGSTKIEGRDFTPIEKKIIEKVTRAALKDMMDAWAEVHPINTEFIRSESNPLVVNVISGEDLLITTRYQLELNKPLGSIDISIPVSSFQPIRHILAGNYRDEEEAVDQTWINNLQYRLNETEVDMAVNLGHTHLSIKDIMNLQKGDIILLDKKYKESLVANISGIPKYEGFIGQHDRKKIFRVEQPIK